jgi:hypothetical protein
MCYVASHPDCTPEKARGAGNAHEFGASNNNAYPKGMDLHNNEIGIGLAKPGTTLSECFDKCEKAAKEGNLCWFQERDKNAKGDIPSKAFSMPQACANRIHEFLTAGWFPFLNQ